jgi:hypothetical protein
VAPKPFSAAPAPAPAGPPSAAQAPAKPFATKKPEAKAEPAKPASKYESSVWQLINDFDSTLSALKSISSSFPSPAAVQQQTAAYDATTSTLLSLRASLHSISEDHSKASAENLQHLATHDDLKRQVETANSLLLPSASGSAPLSSQPLSTPLSAQQQALSEKMLETQQRLTQTQQRIALHQQL